MALLGAPAQRIGYFGPNSGGIVTMPPRPVDPPISQVPISMAPPVQQGLPVPIPSTTDQTPQLGQGLNLHSLLAAAAAHPQGRLYPQIAGGQDPGLARLALLRAMGHPHVESNSSYEAHLARNRAALGRPQFSA